MYISSLACPFNCAYCTNAGVYGRKWNALPVEQVVEESIDLTRRYRLEMLWVVDDNFLVDLDRARLIADGLVSAGAQFRWSIQATTNLTARLSTADLKLLRRSGLHQICQGVDSGSPKILKLMNKTFQDFDSIFESAARCLEAGIRPSFNIIFAYPGEGSQERRETIDFMMDVCRRFPGAEFWTNIFTPYPGSPIMQHVEELGIQVPTSLEGWADFFPRYTQLPWLNGRDHKRLQVMRDYLRIAFDRVPIALIPASSRLVWLRRPLLPGVMARPDFYRAPVEPWLNENSRNELQPKTSGDANASSRPLQRRPVDERQSRTVLPSVRRAGLGAPLCLLSLASPLLQAGFEVRIVDAAVVPTGEQNFTEIQDASVLGSRFTGPMIRGAVRVAKAAKRSDRTCLSFSAAGT